jgi:hypothetical protein
MLFLRLLFMCVALYVLAAPGVSASLREGDCEVCLKVIGDFEVHMKENKIKKKGDVLREIKTRCSQYKQGSKESRMCYYIGGNEDSASGMLREVRACACA